MAGLPGEWTSGARSEFGGGVDSHILGKNRAELGSAALLAGSLFRFVGLLGHVTSIQRLSHNVPEQKAPKNVQRQPSRLGEFDCGPREWWISTNNGLSLYLQRSKKEKQPAVDQGIGFKKKKKEKHRCFSEKQGIREKKNVIENKNGEPQIFQGQNYLPKTFFL